MQNPSNLTDHTATAWYDPTGFNLTANITDGNVHKLSLYNVDFDHGGRTETFTVKDAGTGTVLDAETLASFSGGQYLSWNISGNVEIDVAKTTGDNAVVSGVFFDPAGVTPTPTNVSVLPSDGEADVSWNGVPTRATYNVFRTDSGGNTVEVASAVTTTTYQDTSAVNGTSYTYAVSATGPAGDSPHSSSSASSTPGGVWTPVTDSSGNPIMITPDIMSSAISDFGSSLAAGTYRVDYTSGLMTYSHGNQGYRVNAWRDGNFGFEVAQNEAVNPSSDLHAPGTDVESSSPTNTPTTGTAFSFAGGSLGVYLHDNPYGDNAAYASGSTPTFELETLTPVITVVKVQDASEDGRKPALFTIKRSGGIAQSLNIYYSLAGAVVGQSNVDGTYSPQNADVSGPVSVAGESNLYVVTLPAGEASAQVELIPLNNPASIANGDSISLQLENDPNVGENQPPYLGDGPAGPTSAPTSAPATAIKYGLKITSIAPHDRPTHADIDGICAKIDNVNIEYPELAQLRAQLIQDVLKDPDIADYYRSKLATVSPETQADLLAAIHMLKITVKQDPIDPTAFRVTYLQDNPQAVPNISASNDSVRASSRARFV